MPALTPEYLQRQQEERYWDPTAFLEQDFYEVYDLGQIEVGWPDGARRLFEEIARAHTAGFIGLMFGDEGKGRFVDNKIEELLTIDGVKMVYVVRYQGGSNAGHSLQHGEQRFAVHQIPSGILYPEAVGVMDQGMVIHPENLKIEIEDIEAKVGDLRGKLVLSEEAILATDLERAEEVFNRMLSGGKSGGGTSMGMGPSYSGYIDRTGMQVKDFFRDSDELGVTWREKLAKRYDNYEKYFAAFGYDLKDMEVPDLRATRTNKSATARKVGTKEEFLDRFESVRTWFLNRDADMGEKKMVQNTFILHHKIFPDLDKGIVVEGSQAAGLHTFIGSKPDVTGSDTTMSGVVAGTAVLRPQDIKDRIGVFKITYTSKVPDRNMPTQIAMPADFPERVPAGADLKEFLQTYLEARMNSLTTEQIHAIRIIMQFGEFGTTTGRFRGIHHLDLAIARYNARISNIEMLGGTHLDAALLDEHGEPEPIYVCTHYTRNGRVVPYQPGLEYTKGITPHYERLPGWDGAEAQKARTFDELPENAKKFLAFIQRRMGIPIVAVTTGPERRSYHAVPNYIASVH